MRNEYNSHHLTSIIRALGAGIHLILAAHARITGVSSPALPLPIDGLVLGVG